MQIIDTVMLSTREKKGVPDADREDRESVTLCRVHVVLDDHAGQDEEALSE